jgi:hypothetical protein
MSFLTTLRGTVEQQIDTELSNENLLSAHQLIEACKPFLQKNGSDTILDTIRLMDEKPSLSQKN